MTPAIHERIKEITADRDIIIMYSTGKPQTTRVFTHSCIGCLDCDHVTSCLSLLADQRDDPDGVRAFHHGQRRPDGRPLLADGQGQVR